MAALVATAWQRQWEVDLGVLQRRGTTAGRMQMVPELPALPAQAITSSCRSCLGGFFGDLDKLEFDSGAWGWSLVGIRGGQQLESCHHSVFGHQTGSGLGQGGNVHPRSCSAAEILPCSLCRPLAPSCLTVGAAVGRQKHLGWPFKEIPRCPQWRPASEASRFPQPGRVQGAFPPFPRLPSTQSRPAPSGPPARRCRMAPPKADGFPARESSVTAEGERPLAARWFPLAALRSVCLLLGSLCRCERLSQRQRAAWGIRAPSSSMLGGCGVSPAARRGTGRGSTPRGGWQASPLGNHGGSRSLWGLTSPRSCAGLVQPTHTGRTLTLQLHGQLSPGSLSAGRVGRR